MGNRLKYDQGDFVMTEAEWLECADPMPMLEFLRGKASDRKLRLFACACIHEHLNVNDKQLHEALKVAEGYADREVADDDCDSARQALIGMYGESTMQPVQTVLRL